MSTFLELCQSVAADSGTVSDTSLLSPATVTGQTGRLLRVVNWTKEAYRQLQVMRSDWEWLRAEFEGETLVNVRRYSLNETNERWRNWVFTSSRGDPTFSCWLTATGQTDERWLQYRPWEYFRRTFLFGDNASETGRPAYISVDPQGQLVLHPIPDAAYTIRGEFMRGPQILAADAEEPELPEEYHEAIKWKALILLGIFDEAVEQVPAWQAQLDIYLDGMVLTQTPRVELTGALA